MKVGLVLPGFAADAADWCIPALTNLVRALAAAPGIDLHVFALRYPPQPGVYQLHGATIHAFGGAPIAGRRVRGTSMGLLWVRFLAALRHEARREPFAVLHGFWATEAGFLATRAGAWLRIPALVHLAGGELTHDRCSGYGNQAPGLARLLVAGSVHGATHLTVPSGTLRDQLGRRYPRHLPKAVDWALGVDTQMFAPAPAEADGPARPASPAPALSLVHVASLLPVKNQTLLLEGLARARAQAPRTSITLTIAGEGPQETILRTRVARLGLADTVYFAGAVAHDALPALYRAHDVFVLTSRHEAQGMALLEAAACGRPWISVPVGAPADLAGIYPLSGWSVPPHDPHALAAAILAAADPVARSTYGAAARTLVQRAYALDTQVARLIGLYAHVKRTA